MNTPDTEEEIDKEYSPMPKIALIGATLMSYGVVGKNKQHIKKLVYEIYEDATSSRDTYWKERFERVRRDLKARMSHEDYTKCETCEETLYHIDNLK